jgi:hypothetical protein
MALIKARYEGGGGESKSKSAVKPTKERGRSKATKRGDQVQ